MLYIRITDNLAVEYPVDPVTRHPSTSFPIEWPGGEVEGVTYAAVEPTDQPVWDVGTTKLVEGQPIFTNGVWRQQWLLVPLSAEELAVALAARRAEMVVSPLQAMLALSQAGLLTTVENLVSAADPVTQLAWHKAREFRRTSPLILTMAAALDWSEADLDDLFTTAAGIEV